MQKTKTKIITILLLAAVTLAVIPFANASTGFITVNTVPAIIPAGGNIDLGFAGVTWSGGQFYLLLSTDGFSQVSPGDVRYTPSFNVADLTALTTKVVTDPTYPGSWTIGNNQIVGSIPSNIAGGTYYIKAFDGLVTSLAVTSPAFTVIGAITVTPTSGAPGTSITIKGNAFPANALVNLTYLNPNTAQYVMINNLTQAGAIGNFTWVMPAPDVIGPLVNAAGLNDPAASNTIQFQATENKTAAVYTATYTEMQRGLLQFGTPKAGSVAGNLFNATIPSPTGIYGNGTSFNSAVATGFIGQVDVGVGDTVRIVGNWFYPGNATFKWDNSVVMTPSNPTANGTGYFNTTVTVPGTTLAGHNITIVDANNVVFVVFLNVVQSITINPASGPIGTVVTVNGYGFPGAAGTSVYNATITFDATPVGWALTDATGAFTTTITVPTATGGAHLITATTNSTVVSASKTFTITSAFMVTPSSFYANSSNTEVKASGTGFNPANTFFVAIDNHFSPFTNTQTGIAPDANGNLNFSFIGVGFSPGLHLVSVYQAGTGSGTNKPIANATFTVLADAGSDLLSAVNSTVNKISSNLSAMNATIVAINGNTATLATSIGSLQTSVSSLGGTLSSIQSSIANIQTPNLGPITTSLADISAKIDSLSGDTATISSSVGSLTTSLQSIDTKVTSISGDTATTQTTLGTLSGKVDSVSGNVATITTSLGTITADISNLKSDVSSAKSTTETLSPLIIVAIVLALIAAIAAIASIVLMRRKIAG